MQDVAHILLLAIHHNESEIVAFRGFGSLDKPSNLTVVNPSCRGGEIVGYLNELCDMASMDNGIIMKKENIFSVKCSNR